MIFNRKISILMCVVTLFFASKLRAVIIVSLGGDCTLASVLRTLDLRKNAYPFDWMFASFNAIYKSIETDFEKFLDPDTLKVRDDGKTIIDHYGFLFVHDFPTIHHAASVNDGDTHEWAEIRSDWRNSIPLVREKYYRRIERFKAALTGNDHVLLMRYGILKSEAIQLRDLINRKYPQLSFSIIAVNNIQGALEKIENWAFDKIKNFYLRENTGPIFWQDWKNMFHILQVNPANSR